MGNCLSSDVAKAYRIGGAQDTKEEMALREAAAATALVTGSLASGSTIELRITCVGLSCMDAFSQSDPMAILWEQVNGSWKEVGRTEVQTNNQSPVFVRTFKVLYNFEKMSKYKIQLIDVDDGLDPMDVPTVSSDQLGEVEFFLSEVVTTQTKVLTKEVIKDGQPDNGALVTIEAEELSNARETLTLTFEGSSLVNLETFGQSDPFLEIHRQQGDDGRWVPVFKTEVKMNNLNPLWRPIVIKGTQLNNGDAYKPLRLKVFDYEITGSHRLIGQVETTALKLEEMARERGLLPLQNPAQPGKVVGDLIVRDFKSVVYPSFLDYIQAGVEIAFIVAVDFTASNGPPTETTSLHYLNPVGGMTKYEEAITSIARVLEFYDSDRAFPSFGFGGQRPPHVTNHCFHLNGQQNPVCIGLEGICNAYRDALQVYTLSGPTLFAPVIKMSCAIAQQPTSHLRYLVLLILTDGAIMDMEDTIDAIVLASRLPISIIIVGVGNADFSSMDTLDADGKVLKSTMGRVAERDIVQFVPFSQFQNNGELLAAEVLAELPSQFLDYVRARGIKPPPPAVGSPPGTPPYFPQ